MAACIKKLGLTSDTRANEAILKKRVIELEDEILALKKRLDDLRKAKNTTILKREREVLQVGTPFGRRDGKTGAEAASKSYDDDHSREMDQLRKQFASEMESIRKVAEEAQCDHLPQITALSYKCESLEADNAALLMENSDLKERVDSLVTQLSIKEASWCENEEKLKREIQRSWGEKYREWMQQTEGKIQELQQTNDLLRGYLMSKRPGEPNPLPTDKQSGGGGGARS